MFYLLSFVLLMLLAVPWALLLWASARVVLREPVDFSSVLKPTLATYAIIWVLACLHATKWLPMPVLIASLWLLTSAAGTLIASLALAILQLPLLSRWGKTSAGDAFRYVRASKVLAVGFVVATLIGYAVKSFLPTPWNNAATSVDLEEVRASCQKLLHVRGLAAPALLTSFGDGSSFQLLQERVVAMRPVLAASSPEENAPQSSKVANLQRSAEALLSRRSAVLSAHDDLKIIQSEAPDLLSATQEVWKEELEPKSPASRLSAATELMLLAQRIDKSAGHLYSIRGVAVDSIFSLSKDARTFVELAEGLRDGNPELLLPLAQSDSLRTKLSALIARFERTGDSVKRLSANAGNLGEAGSAQAALLASIAALDRELQPLCHPPGLKQGAH